MGRLERTLTLGTADGTMEAYEVAPSGGPRGAVIVIQEAFGLNDHIREVTRRVAEEGYHTLAPALFHRAGGGTAPYDDFEQVLPLFEGLTDDGILMDVDAARDHLAAAGFPDRQVGLVGFCFGGRVSFLVAVRRRLAAAVGFYGGGIVNARRPQFPSLLDQAATMQTPWLGLFGDLDAHIPVDEVEQLRGALAAAAVASEIRRYEDADHGFFCNEQPSFNEVAARDGWSRTLDWFQKHLG